MADQETLAALKRAYADTILNTTKEAAARVMVSEKKARSYQQELVTVRDEALHTLLRLKHMLDSKVKETEITSLKQQQKVEELEAQLGEAEDIVGELRTELRELQDELMKLTNGQTHLERDHEKDRNAAVSVVPEVCCSPESIEAVASCIPAEQNGSVVANGIKLSSLTYINSINRCCYKTNKAQCHYTLPSILKKRKEAEGCSKIIQATDSSMVNGVLSSSVEVGDVNGDKVSSCKSVETLETSVCADATNSISSVKDEEAQIGSSNSPQKNVGTSLSMEHENEIKLSIVETEAGKEEKESSEHMDMEISASPLCEENPVLALSKNRCIKYTFKRKRKRESSSNVEGDSRNMKQKSEEKEEGYLESLKPTFTSESSGDVVYA